MMTRSLLTSMILLILTIAANAGVDPAILAQLGDASYDKREAAMTTLLTDESVTTEDVVAMHRQAKSAEQRHRLITIARHVYTREAIGRYFADDQREGAMGIVNETLSEWPGGATTQTVVRINHTFPGFPAYGRMRPRDLILAVDGRTAQPQGPLQPQWLAETVRNKRPGDEVTFSVFREGKVIEVTFALTDKRALDVLYSESMNIPNAQRIRDDYVRGWAALYQQLSQARPEPVTLTPTRIEQ